MTQTTANPDKITIYGHTTCPGVPPVKAMLAYAKVDYAYIDIRGDAQAAALVRSINGGNESVPTLIFPDGSTLTEPSASELKRKLEASGHKVSVLAWLLGSGWQIVIGLVILFALLRFLEIF